MRVLIAEDNGLTLVGLEMMLEKMGHEVVATASDGEEAYRKLLSEEPELALLDINMPKMSGIEVLKALGQQIDIPCIFLTAYSDESFVKEAACLGVAGYVLKPVTEDQLRVQIEISVSQKNRLQKANESAAYYKKTLEERKLIERAKGILMERMGLSESEAMKRLQKKSRDENKRLVVIAENIIRANEAF